MFKCIDEQDNEETGRSQFHWENPHAQKVTKGNEKLVAELFREYLEFYKMDYTLNIFQPEANLTGSTDKADLAKRAGMGKATGQKPIIVQILEAFMSGDKGAPAPAAVEQERKTNFGMFKFDEPAKHGANKFEADKVSSNYDDDFSLHSSDKGARNQPDQQEESV